MKAKRQILLIAGAAGFYLLHRTAKRWGATDKEVLEPLPGDDIVLKPFIETNHAVTISTPPAAVWPWLVQAGYHRGGWYGDDLTESMFMKFFWRVIVPEEERAEFRPSATKILPEFQNLAVGDIVPDGPPGTAYFTVRDMAAEQHLVLYSDSHLSSFATRFLKDTAIEPYGEFTWVFVLKSVGASGTRLILRTRADYGPPLFRLLGWPFFAVAEALFTYQILNGIRKRAEGLAGSG